MDKNNKMNLINYDDVIIKLTGTICSDQGNSRYNNANVQVCTEMFHHIVNCYGSGEILKLETIDAYFEYITTTKSHYRYYAENKCIHLNPAVIAQTIMILFKRYIPEINIIKELLTESVYDECYNSLNENHNFTGLSDQLLLLIIENRLEFSLDDNNETCLIDFIFRNIKFTAEEILLLCRCRNTILSEKLSDIINKFPDDFTDEYMSIASGSLPYTKAIIQSLIMRKVKITSTHLNIVCAGCDIGSIEFILQTTKLPITREHARSLITSRKYNKQPINVRHPNDEYEHWGSGYSIEKMELLIKYGYKLDYDDVVYSINYKIELPISRFNIDLDKKLLDLCWDNDFYPAYPWECIDANMIELQKECTTRKLKNIKSLLHTHKLVPDRKCMENAAKFASNIPTYNALISSGGIPTYKCIKNCAATLHNNRYLMEIIGDFDKVYNDEIKQYQDKIKKLEEDIAKIKNLEEDIATIDGKIEPIEPSVIPKIRVVKRALPKHVTKGESYDNKITAKKSTTKLKHKNAIVVDDKIIPKKVKHKNVIIVEDSEDDETKIDLPIKSAMLSIDSTRVQELQKKYRLKSDPPLKLIKTFAIDKTKQLSYIDIKKYLLGKMITDKWVDETEKEKIRLPDNVKKNLNINIESIQIGDIDKLICMFLI